MPGLLLNQGHWPPIMRGLMLNQGHWPPGGGGGDQEEVTAAAPVSQELSQLARPLGHHAQGPNIPCRESLTSILFFIEFGLCSLTSLKT